MKTKTHKIIMLILAVMLSFIFWLYVMALEDPEGEKQVKNVKVVIVGQETLATRNLSVISNTSTINLTFKGRRTDLNKLESDTVSVSVDVADIMTAGSIRRLYSAILWPEGVSGDSVTVYNISTQIDLLIDRNDSKVVPVKLNANSNIKPLEGYIVDRSSISPDEVRINGPATVLETINHAEVWLEEIDLDQTVERTKGYTLVTSSGEAVDDTNLERVPGEVLVTIPIHKTKEVSLDVEFKDGGGITLADNVTFSIEPPSITISGDAATLEPINLLKIGQIDLSKVAASRTVDFLIPLPNDTDNLSGVTTATVTVEITGATTRSMGVTNIECINGDIPEGYKINLITKEITVQVRGPNAQVDQVRPFNIRVVVDLQGQTLQQGQMNTTVAVYVDGYSKVGAVGEYRVALELVPVVEDDS